MILSTESLAKVSVEGVKKPQKNIFSLPEKVLQFGTGVLLRGLIDDYIDKANRSGIFNGRVVVVKSTSAGGTDAFAGGASLSNLLSNRRSSSALHP